MQNGLAAARVTNGNIQGALEAYQRAYDLQPSRAANSVNLARIHDQKGDLLLTLECFNKAVELDPNDTSIRLERAEWLLAHKNPDGVNDLKFVIAQRDKPYGLYAATPEWVNLDYARATIKLLPYLWQEKQFQLASDLVAKAQGETAHARANQGLQQEMMKELGAASALRPDTDLDELESDLADWKSKLDSALKK
jgi:tetratricopeptide (TPR) repeat protein